jgi:hypothetical protein
MRLLADTQVPGLEIDLDSYDGVVTLFGMVPSHEAKAFAGADTLKVSGVKHVVNELQVVASSRQEAVSARDDDLQREVRTALDEHAFRDVRLEVAASPRGVSMLTIRWSSVSPIPRKVIDPQFGPGFEQASKSHRCRGPRSTCSLLAR